MMTATASSRSGTIAGWTLLLASIALVAYGLATSRVFAQRLWQPGGLLRLAALCAVYAIFAVAIYFTRPRALGPVLAAGGLLCAAQAVGLFPILAVALLAASSIAIGSRLLRVADTPVLELLTGAAVLSLAAGIAVHFPINYRWVYAVALLAPLPFALPALRGAATRAGRILTHPALRSPATFAACAALAFLLLLDLVKVLAPETGYDALAVHLMAPAWIAAHGRWIFDPQQYAWSVMPMGADWLYTIAYLLGGEFAARLANFGALLAIVATLAAIARSARPRAAVALAAALFCSTPLSGMVTGSLFIENILAATILGAVLAIDRLRRSGESVFLFAAALLLGVALSMKLGAVSCAIPLAIFALAARPLPAGRRAAAAALFLAIGAAPYLYTWQAAGSPLYPFVDGLFRSPYPAHIPPPADSLYRMTFRSHEYLEAADGAFGFQWMLFAPAVLLVFARRIPYAIRAAGAAAVVSAIAVATAQPYLRYLYPAAALFTVVICFVPTAAGKALARAVLVIGAACLLLNLYFLPASGWYLANVALPPPLGFGNANAPAYLMSAAPARGIVDYLNRAHRGEPAWFIGTNEIAGLEGTAYAAEWHEPRFRDEIARARDEAAILAVVQAHGLRNFVAPADLATVQPAPVREFLERRTAQEYRFGAFALYRLSD